MRCMEEAGAVGMNCVKCGLPIVPATLAVKFRGKAYHPECMEAVKVSVKAKETKKAQKINDPSLAELKKYLYHLFQLKELTPLLEKQIGELSHQYSYQELLLTLRYFFDLSEGTIDPERPPTIGIVPYVHDEAMRYWVQAQAAQQQSELPQAADILYQFTPSSATNPCRYSMEDL